MAFNILSKTLERDMHYYSRLTHLLLQKNNYATSKVLQCNNKPIKYSITTASKMSTEDTFGMKPDKSVLSCEPYIIIGSLFTLLIYSFIREENKIDRILDGSFKYKDDDEIKLLNALLHAKLKGLNTNDIENKLNLLKQNKNKSN